MDPSLDNLPPDADRGRFYFRIFGRFPRRSEVQKTVAKMALPLKGHFVLINEITNCETVIASDESVRLRLELSPVEGEDLQIDLNDSQCRIVLTYCIEHLYESKKDLFAECLHETLQGLAYAALDLDEEEDEE